jgi:two-component system OmpR family response regulator
LERDTGTILVVDDEEEICNFLKDYLETHGYQVFTANDGEAMRTVMSDNNVDLVILDLVMPGEDGLTLTRYLRENSNVAVIILTGKDEEVDRIVGLEMGADDYVAKPFSSRELLARVKTVLRRVNEQGDKPSAAADGGVTRFAGWSFDKVGRRLTSPTGDDVALTTMEFNLLTALTDNPNRVLDRDRLLDLLQNRSWEPYDRSIDVLVGRLRSKIENNPKKPELIKTVRGTGYVLATTVEHE